ncbi:MAG: energy-coupling factor transporter transmembrane protein EcfT [Actinomycetota bacterium]|nr:energy-coupling factor transporter transmembrane protein EcfT [Actinomycetota bacterium]
MSAQDADRRRPSRRDLPGPALGILRPVPGHSPLHRAWAGTKLVVVTVLGIGAVVNPSVVVLAAGWLLAVGTFVLARLPAGVIPRPPPIFAAFLATSLALAWLGGDPVSWLRLVSLTFLLTFAAAVVGWTTPTSDLAPAMARLGRPFRALRVPVDEIVATVALTVRCVPLLGAELRMLRAARATRPRPQAATVSARISEAVDLLVAVLVASVRRAEDLGTTVRARGGVPAADRGERGPGPGDVVAMVVSALVAVLTAVIVP